MRVSYHMGNVRFNISTENIIDTVFTLITLLSVPVLLNDLVWNFSKNLLNNQYHLKNQRPKLCAITLNYCTYTNHVGVSPRALYCVVDTSYGLGRSLGHCRPALPKGRKYQMVKTQTQSHVRRPVV